MIAVGCFDGTTRIGLVRDGPGYRSEIQELLRFNDKGWVHCVAWGPRGNRLATASAVDAGYGRPKKGALRIFEMRTSATGEPNWRAALDTGFLDDDDVRPTELLYVST